MAEQTAPHQHIWKQARSHHAWNQCVCGMRPHSPEHARELERRLEKMEAERDVMRKALSMVSEYDENYKFDLGGAWTDTVEAVRLALFYATDAPRTEAAKEAPTATDG